MMKQAYRKWLPTITRRLSLPGQSWLEKGKSNNCTYSISAQNQNHAVVSGVVVWTIHQQGFESIADFAGKQPGYFLLLTLFLMHSEEVHWAKLLWSLPQSCMWFIVWSLLLRWCSRGCACLHTHHPNSPTTLPLCSCSSKFCPPWCQYLSSSYDNDATSCNSEEVKSIPGN